MVFMERMVLMVTWTFSATGCEHLICITFGLFLFVASSWSSVGV